MTHLKVAKYLGKWLTRILCYFPQILWISGVTEGRKLCPNVPELPYGTNQNVSCIREHRPPHEDRERGSTAFSCVGKESLDLVRIPIATIGQQYNDRSLKIWHLLRVSAYNGHLQGSVYQRKVRLQLTVLEMCRYKTEIRVFNYMVKVKV
jgi:hypothetical protein